MSAYQRHRTIMTEKAYRIQKMEHDPHTGQMTHRGLYFQGTHYSVMEVKGPKHLKH